MAPLCRQESLCFVGAAFQPRSSRLEIVPTKTELQREPTSLEDILFYQTAGLALLSSLSIFYHGLIAIHKNIKMHKCTGVPLVLQGLWKIALPSYAAFFIAR
jgi:hypothetical protein